MLDNSSNFDASVVLSREMHEEAVLQNLKRRFDREIIYVILIAHTEHIYTHNKKICMSLRLVLLFFFFLYFSRRISVVFCCL